MATVLGRCRENLRQARCEVTRLRRELTAVDESLGEFYCSVRGGGSFYLDHGVHLMRTELEKLRCNHSAFNWDKQKNGDWRCGGLVPSHTV